MGGKKKSRREAGRDRWTRRGGRGVKAGVQVCCINAVYSKSHVGGPRLLATEASCPVSVER